jgi:hypothetical protein
VLIHKGRPGPQQATIADISYTTAGKDKSKLYTLRRQYSLQAGHTSSTQHQSVLTSCNAKVGSLRNAACEFMRRTGAYKCYRCVEYVLHVFLNLKSIGK